VRPAFAAARPQALARRAAAEGPARVLVSLGLTDVGGITGRLVARMQPRLGQSKLDVVLGSGAPSLEAVERLAARDPRIAVHRDVRDMAGLTAEADLVVGAGGSSSWERCVLGAPTLLVVLAENQAPGARALEKSGAVELADARAPEFEAAFDRAFTGLLASPDRRRRLSRASAALCDGQGPSRVADALEALLAG
jgi:spore coat polysaccharide biosynthesis predicted glycosyltransferase SpsG